MLGKGRKYGPYLSLCLSALSLWVFFQRSSPTFSVQNFYLPALHKTLNSTATATTNTSIYFDIEFDNPNRNYGIYFNTLNLTFYYKSSSNQTYFAVANQTFDEIYQGTKEKDHRTGMVEAVGVPWREVRRGVSNGSKPVFRVGLVTSFRFKFLSLLKTKKHDLVVGADVAVNDSGEKDKRKGIQLKSGAPEIRCGRTRPLVIGSIVLLSLLSII